jgi:hypothetical protein
MVALDQRQIMAQVQIYFIDLVHVCEHVLLLSESFASITSHISLSRSETSRIAV